MTYVDVPPKAAMLHSLEVPPPEAGGNTYFANMFAAYETLPADLRKRLEVRSRCTMRQPTARACCARATKKSLTSGKRSAHIIPWCAPAEDWA